MSLITVKNLPTSIDINKDSAKKRIKALKKELNEILPAFFAEKKHAILIVLQGMDASGKDGIIRRCLKGIDPKYINVHSFKKPTEEELAHDFLWRVHKRTPKKGEITVFNRSHYEDVLITRAFNLFPEEEIMQRYELINDFEKLLKYNNTIVFKFFLNISNSVQKENLMERKTNPLKFYKHSDGDWEMRKKWDDFMQFYEDAINKCSREFEWVNVPSDKNWMKDITILEYIVEKLKQMKFNWPT